MGLDNPFVNGLDWTRRAAAPTPSRVSFMIDYSRDCSCTSRKQAENPAQPSDLVSEPLPAAQLPGTPAAPPISAPAASQLSTPASASKYTTPFSTPAPELPAAPVVVSMPTPAIPDTSPEFRGEKGKDNLRTWLSKAIKDNLLAKLNKHFAHIDADPDQELQDMTLHVGDDLSTFAHKFVKEHNASSVPHHRAALLFTQKSKHLPQLHQNLVQVWTHDKGTPLHALADIVHSHQEFLK